ncbi:MAG: acyl carrier protein [Lachnospiraceae bacterium]|nr:acyl carrier protein [Lachnospiraceae bacterium]
MREKVKQVLTENYPEIDFESSTELVDDGILDSLTMVGIISALSMEFGVVLPYEDIVPENFNSIDAMVELLERFM